MSMRSQAPSPRKWTLEEYLNIPEDGMRHEIIDGEHYVNAAPVPPHQLVLGELYVLLRRHFAATKEGTVILGPFAVEIPEGNFVEPDLVVLTAAQRATMPKTHFLGAPALVVEILSPSTRRNDLKLKKSLYERAGVREYWVIDFYEQWVEQFCLEAEHLVSRGRHVAKLRCEVVPNLIIQVPELWLSL